MAGPKLYYFDFTGRAEQIRLAFALGGIEFEDVRFSPQEWASKYKAMSPTGQCPWLELEDGTIIVESHALLAYAASMSGMVPSTSKHLALAEQAVCLMDNIFPLTMCAARELTDEVKSSRAKAVELAIRYNALIGNSQHPDGYVAGDKLSMADLNIFCMLRRMYPTVSKEMAEDIENRCPALVKCSNIVAKNPKVAEYCKTH